MIETALREMNEVMVIIYDCPETTNVPLPIRANWIKALYPSVQIIEAWDGPVEVGDTDQIRKAHEDYILNQLKIRGVTHFYSSEFYGDHVSRALGVYALPPAARLSTAGLAAAIALSVSSTICLAIARLLNTCSNVTDWVRCSSQADSYPGSASTALNVPPLVLVAQMMI